MKIAVVCANGKAGQLIVKEAVNRGFDVTAVVKGENKSAAQNVIVKDLFDLTEADLTGFDAVERPVQSDRSRPHWFRRCRRRFRRMDPRHTSSALHFTCSPVRCSFRN